MSPSAATPLGARGASRPALPGVLAEHLEEHAFLCVQRRRLILSPELPLRRLPQHDERIAAHWDGLVVGAPDSVRLALDVMEEADPWELASAARVWLELGAPAPAAVSERLADLTAERAPAWREAFRRASPEVARATLTARAVAALPPAAQAVAVDALAWHGALTEEQAALAARHADAAVRAAVARGLAHAGLDALARLTPLLDDPEPAVARRALWSAVALERPAALERARRRARGRAPDAFAVRVLGLLGEPEDHAVLVEAAATDAGRPAAFWAFADLGTAEAVDSLVRLLALPDRATVAIVAEALEEAVGPIPRPNPGDPPTPAQAAAHAERIAAELPGGARVIAGRARPWRDEPGEEPLRWRWRAALEGRCPEAPWLAREVPDGFFEALPAPDARPGE